MSSLSSFHLDWQILLTIARKFLQRYSDSSQYIDISKIIWNSLYSREGEQWLKMRSVLRQRILKPKDVAIFAGEINQVIADLIKRIYFLKSQAEDGETVTNINDLFFKYSMEGEVKSGGGKDGSRDVCQNMFVIIEHFLFQCAKPHMYVCVILTVLMEPD